MRSPHPAEGMYGSLRHLVKPILEKISVATRTWTASLKPTNSSLVPTSLKTWYPRSLLLTVLGRRGRTRDATMISPSEGNEVRRKGRQGVAALIVPSSRGNHPEGPRGGREEAPHEPLEGNMRLPAIMPPKRGTYIGPLRAATPPPAEGRRCSSLTRRRGLWA